MTNFEEITETPEALCEFLASLPVATGPWDKEFHRAFCDSCELLECRTETCPYKGNRLLWWLMMGGKEGEVPGLSIRIKAAFPVLWDREYYTVAEKKKETRAPCVCCDNTGKVTIKGVEYPCPKCKGNWREKEVVGETTIYSVAKWVLERIDVNKYGMLLTFKCQRRYEIVRKRRRNFVIFRRRGVTKIRYCLAQKECSRFAVSGA